MLTNDLEYVTANVDAGSASDIYWRSLTAFNIRRRPRLGRAKLKFAAETYWKALNTVGRSIDSQPASPAWERRREMNVCYQDMIIPEMMRLGIQFESLEIVATLPIPSHSDKS